MAAIVKLFKGKKEVPTTSDAIQGLRQTEDMLAKKQEYLEKKIKTEEETIRKNVKNNKKLALSALKRKKRFETELQRNDGTLNTLEQVTIHIQFLSHYTFFFCKKSAFKCEYI